MFPSVGERSPGGGIPCERGGGLVSSRLFLLAPVSLRCERTFSTNQKGIACSLNWNSAMGQISVLRNLFVFSFFV